MIYGFSSVGNTNTNVDRAYAAGVHLVRMQDWNTSQPVAATEAIVLYAAEKQVKLIMLYNDGTHSTRGFMALGNLVAQMASVGPNGTFWNGAREHLRQWAPTHIECGNEWSYSYRFAGGNQTLNAEGVAGTVRRFWDAVGPNTAHGMKFICEGEDASSGTDEFLNGLVAAQPTIRSMVDGWTIHGYGPQIQETSQHWGFPNYGRLHNRLNARGWTSDRIWITENGLATDNGATMTLDDGSPNNYGYKYNCTYDEAATRLLAIVRYHGNTAPWAYRVAAYLNYQSFDQQASGSTRREHYFGIYKFDKSAKGSLTSAALTLVSEFPYDSEPTTTPTPGGATAGGNAPSDGIVGEVITFVSVVGTSFFDPPSGFGVLTGAYIKGNQYDATWGDSPWDSRAIAAFEASADKSCSVLHYGQPWKTSGANVPFYPTIADIPRNHGSYPMIGWLPVDSAIGYATNQPAWSCSAIAAGNYDATIDQWFTGAAAWGHPFFCRTMHEMNGSWFPWGVGANGNTAAEFVSAWQRVVTRARAVCPNVTFVWCPNIIFPGVPATIAQVYPGDAYVDWVGIDGYNWGAVHGTTLLTFTQLFQPTYDAIYAVAGASKPLMLGEWGCHDSPGSKAAFFTDAFAVMAAGTAMPRIRAAVYFNWSTDGGNWRIETGAGSQAAYAAAIAPSTFKGADFGAASVSPIPAPTA